MSKTAFYVVERPTNSDNEFKDNDDDNSNFVEEITLDYAFSQSVLFKIYGGGIQVCQELRNLLHRDLFDHLDRYVLTQYWMIQETGHRTRGHVCLSDTDKDCSKALQGSLLYGELLPRGVNKALGSKHLNAANARSLFDLGKILVNSLTH